MYISVSDLTLRENETLSFKEKTETAKLLDRLCVDVIEAPPIKRGKSDTLFLHTIAPLLKNSRLSCAVVFPTSESIKEAYDAIRTAQKRSLNIMLPVSTVQMEYICHKKPDKMLDLIRELVKTAADLCDDTEVSFVDSTRAEPEFLIKAIKAAVESGAARITVCDSAGIMLPTEFSGFIEKLLASVPELSEIGLGVECSDELNMAVACTVSAIGAGAVFVKTAVDIKRYPQLMYTAKVLNEKSELMGTHSGIDFSVFEDSVSKIRRIIGDHSTSIVAHDDDSALKGVLLGEDADRQTILLEAGRLGYELSDSELDAVYQEYQNAADRKNVDLRELEAIIAGAMTRIAPTYVLKSYVINSGNVMMPTANIEIEKNGEILRGLSTGDGPIDASFKAIEQIIGNSCELDDFKIRAVTRGYESLGESIVRLRFDGRLYSGRGISTDIVGASICAYLNALNKISNENN